jgi:hypothetical protein
VIEFRPKTWQMTSITAIVLFVLAVPVIIGVGGSVVLFRLVALAVMAVAAGYWYQLRRLVVQVEPGLVRIHSWRTWREYRRGDAVAIPASMKMTVGDAESIVLRRADQRIGGYRIALDDFPRDDRARMEDAILAALKPRYED